MTWVPFVHALLVDDQPQSIAQATVVPPDLLSEVLTEGRQTLESETIELILRLVAEGVLDGLQAIAPDGSSRPAGVGARLAECSDSPAATASSSPSTLSDLIPREPQYSSPTPPGSTAAAGCRSRPSPRCNRKTSSRFRAGPLICNPKAGGALR